MVSHDGAEWLPRLLAALDSATRRPDEVIGVDTGSRDASVPLLATSPLVDAVQQVDSRTGFGAAVAAGLAAADARAATGDAKTVADSWIWLLHDDCAPAPDALRRLLEVAEQDADVDVVGCRIRGWPSGRRLLEVGVSITGTGHRETGLEPGEHDQGQYDEVRDVLAVSSAGMLVRRRVWDALGGFDPELPLFRDDVDFGWRAVAAGYRVVVVGRAGMFHDEASSRGVRAHSTVASRPHRADRRAALFVLLANCRAAAVPFVYLRLLGGTLLRAASYLLGKLPATAWDELCAGAAVFGRPWSLAAARARRRPSRAAAADVRRLLPPWWAPYANGLDAVLARFGEPARERASTVTASAHRLRRQRFDGTGRRAPGGARLLGPFARHPLLSLIVLLTLTSVLATRGLLGGGFLQGGALPPAPDGARNWWTLYTEQAHAVGMGSTTGTEPYVAMLALGATVLLGKAWLVVDVLMLLAPLLCGIGAWWAAGVLVRGIGTRFWMAATYGLVPLVTGAAASGHLGTVVVAIVLPWVARGAARLAGSAEADGWRAASAVGLSLSVSTAFAPVSWPIATAAGLVAAARLAWRRRSLRVAQWALAVLLPLVLLLPWSWRVARHPGLLLSEAGVTVVPGGVVDGWQLAFARVNAAGDAPWWVTAGLTGVALLALLRADTRGRVVSAWLLIVCALTAAAVMAGQSIPLPGGITAAPWLGVPVVVASAGAVAAAGMAADGLGSFIGAGTFGWRQPVAAVTAAAGVGTLLLGLGWAVAAAPHGSLRRDVAVPVPAYMIDAMSTRSERVLVLRSHGSSVGYAVLAGDGLRLGDDSVLPPDADPALADVVADLLSQGRPASVRALGADGIGYVVLPSPQTASAAAQLDAAAGLTRTSSNRSVLSGWQLDARLVRPVTLPSAGNRTWLLALQAALWLCSVLLAAPALSRRPLPADSQQT